MYRCTDQHPEVEVSVLFLKIINNNKLSVENERVLISEGIIMYDICS